MKSTDSQKSIKQLLASLIIRQKVSAPDAKTSMKKLHPTEVAPKQKTRKYDLRLFSVLGENCLGPESTNF